MSAQPYNIEILQDHREKTPFQFGQFEGRVSVVHMKTGDYTIRGFESVFAIERKALPDLVGCVAQSRARFQRELSRLARFRYAAVVIEANYEDVMNGNWYSKVSPQSVIGSIASWQIRYHVPFLFAGSMGAHMTLSLMRKFLAANGMPTASEKRAPQLSGDVQMPAQPTLLPEDSPFVLQ